MPFRVQVSRPLPLTDVETTQLKRSVAGYFLGRSILQVEPTEEEEKAASWSMRCSFVMFYHILAFAICLSKSAVYSRLQKLDKAHGRRESYGAFHPPTRYTRDIPEVSETDTFLGNEERPDSQHLSLYSVDSSGPYLKSSLLGVVQPMKPLHPHIFKLNVVGSSLEDSTITVVTRWVLKRHCLFFVRNDTRAPVEPISSKIAPDKNQLLSGVVTSFPPEVVAAVNRDRENTRVILVVALANNSIFLNQLLSAVLEHHYPITHLQIAFTFNKGDHSFPAIPLRGPFNMKISKKTTNQVPQERYYARDTRTGESDHPPDARVKESAEPKTGISSSHLTQMLVNTRNPHSPARTKYAIDSSQDYSTRPASGPTRRTAVAHTYGEQSDTTPILESRQGPVPCGHDATPEVDCRRGAAMDASDNSPATTSFDGLHLCNYLGEGGFDYTNLPQYHTYPFWSGVHWAPHAEPQSIGHAGPNVDYAYPDGDVRFWGSGFGSSQSLFTDVTTAEPEFVTPGGTASWSEPVSTLRQTLTSGLVDPIEGQYAFGYPDCQPDAAAVASSEGSSGAANRWWSNCHTNGLHSPVPVCPTTSYNPLPELA